MGWYILFPRLFMARTPEAARLLGQYAVRVWETKNLRKLKNWEN